VKSAVKDYAQAIADSDQEAACELLTDHVKDQVEQDTGKQCQAFVANVASFCEVDLAKEGDDWKISDPDDADLGTEITP
jgi:hypothetical protein